MDKSLGWFKSKSKSKPKKHVDSRKTNSSMDRASAKKAPLQNTQDKLQLFSESFRNHSDFIMSTPKLGKKSRESFKSDFEHSLIDNSCSLNISDSNFILLNAPSMASSFEELRLHSTPCKTVCQNLSPIRYSSQQEISSLASSSIHSNSSCSSQSCNIGSFGMTSSPVSKYNNNQSLQKNYAQNSYQDSDNIYEFDSQCKSEHSIQANYAYLNSREQRLVDHLNRIKQNVRLGIELRDLQSIRGETTKRNYNLMKSEEESLALKSNENKRRKLQHIFHVKLHRQIKEIKKWQTALKIKFESKSENLKHKKNQMFAKSEPISSSSYNYYLSRYQTENLCDDYQPNETCNCETNEFV